MNGKREGSTYIKDEHHETMQEMFHALSNAPNEILPSKFWVELNNRNLTQLEEQGYENFKRTIALNYFTWLVSFSDEQIKYLRKNLGLLSVIKSTLRALLSGRHEYFSKKQSLEYNFLTNMLWEYVTKNDNERILDKLHEPTEGNPPKVYLHDKLISQDLANSVLEFKSIMNSGVDKDNIQTVMELGAGYGRTAFVFLSLMPAIRYIIVDIPPALYIAQRYLSNQFPKKKIFKFRVFNNYAEINKELDNSDIAFFLPNQLELLPEKSTDIFINISSLHEMRPDQIEYYFSEIDRLTKKYFYFKQWKVSKIPFENIIIKENDYPVRKEWSRIYWMECKVQTNFFESLYDVRSLRK